jgi:hypothetical protein
MIRTTALPRALLVVGLIRPAAFRIPCRAPDIMIFILPCGTSTCVRRTKSLAGTLTSPILLWSLIWFLSLMNRWSHLVIS